MAIVKNPKTRKYEIVKSPPSFYESKKPTSSPTPSSSTSGGQSRINPITNKPEYVLPSGAVVPVTPETTQAIQSGKSDIEVIGSVGKKSSSGGSYNPTTMTYTSPTGQMQSMSQAEANKVMTQSEQAKIPTIKDTITSKIPIISAITMPFKNVSTGIVETQKDISEATKYSLTEKQRIEQTIGTIDRNFGGWIPGGIKPSEVKRIAEVKNYKETIDILKDKNIYELEDIATSYDWKKDYLEIGGTKINRTAFENLWVEKSSERLQERLESDTKNQLEREFNSNLNNIQNDFNSEINKIDEKYYAGSITLEERNKIAEDLQKQYNKKLEEKNTETADKITKEWWEQDGKRMANFYSLQGQKLSDFIGKKQLVTLKNVSTTIAGGIAFGAVGAGAVGLGLISSGTATAIGLGLGGAGLGYAGTGVYTNLSKLKEQQGYLTKADIVSAVAPTAIFTIAGIGGGIAGGVAVGGAIRGYNARQIEQFKIKNKVEINEIVNKLRTDRAFQERYITADAIKKGYVEVNVAGKDVQFKINARTLNRINKYAEQEKLLKEGQPTSIIKTGEIGIAEKTNILLDFKNTFAKAGKYSDLSVGEVDSGLFSARTSQLIKGQKWYSVSGKVEVGNKIQNVQYIFQWSKGGGIKNPYVVTGQMETATSGILFRSRVFPRKTISGKAYLQGETPLIVESLPVSKKIDIFKLKIEQATKSTPRVKITETKTALWDVKNPKIIGSKSDIKGVNWQTSKSEMPLTEFLGTQKAIAYKEAFLSRLGTSKTAEIFTNENILFAGDNLKGGVISKKSLRISAGESVGFKEPIVFDIKTPKTPFPKTEPSLLSETSAIKETGGASRGGSQSLYGQKSASLLSADIDSSILSSTVPQVKTTLTPPKITSVIKPSMVSTSKSTFILPVITPDIRGEKKNLFDTNTIISKTTQEIKPNTMLGFSSIISPISRTATKTTTTPIFDIKTPQAPKQELIAPTTLQPPVKIKPITTDFTMPPILPPLPNLGEVQVGGGQRRMPGRTFIAGKTKYTASLGSILLRSKKQKVTKEELKQLETKKYSGLGLRPQIELVEEKSKKKKSILNIF